ncbi:MAG: formylglycine-generating enzyme family protein, partial [Cyanobacteria bacterium J06636_27]
SHSASVGNLYFIPGGTFLMGSLEDEKNSYKSERPQHEVTIKPFFMGKFLITKAQWKAVEKLPKIEQDLKPDSFRWIGTDCPVEFVDWDIAIEFCARLSKATGKKYRLPTEAEWEYACRAGTTTPFRYGETITSELANYRADQSRSTYAQESFGEYRQKIIPVGQFLPNAFGLYDMHGNGAEWCQDVWHDNYEGAPTDGSAWIDNDEKDRERVIRGGAWLTDVRICRSAARFGFEPTNKYESRYRHEIGSFRIVSNVF